jgi:hypothetical protein
MNDLLHHQLDVPKLLLAVVAAVAVFAATMAASERVPYRAKHLDDASFPYSFSYPGDWKREGASDQPSEGSATIANWSALHKGDQGEITVETFTPSSPVQVISAVRADYQDHHAIVKSQKHVTVAGIRGVELQADTDDGILHDRTTILFAGPQVGFWIRCVAIEPSKDDTQTACTKVLDSFKVTNLDLVPGGTPSVPPIGPPAA